jgi:hypothetical protein
MSDSTSNPGGGAASQIPSGVEVLKEMLTNLKESQSRVETKVDKYGDKLGDVERRVTAIETAMTVRNESEKRIESERSQGENRLRDMRQSGLTWGTVVFIGIATLLAAVLGAIMSHFLK